MRQVKKVSLPVPTEHIEALALKQYLDILVAQKRVSCYSHIVNEFKLGPRFMGLLYNLKLEGWNRGVPDYIIVLPHNEVLWVELKRTKGSTVSTEQKAWIEALNWPGGNSHARACKGFDEARAFIDTYIDLKA
jgi:hypothetical protein